MGALQSIPFCSREKQKEGGGDVPPLQLDNNNNEAVVADQPAAVAQTPATGTAGDPVATSTPRQRSGSGLAEELTVDDGLELSSGFENPHFDRVTGGVGTEEDGVVGGQGKVRVTSCEEGAEDSDDIGPVVDQVIGGSSSDEDGEDDSGLALQEFRKRHNLDIQQLRREAMTPPALDGDPDRPLDDGGHDPLYDCIIDDDNFEDVLDDDDDDVGDVEDDDETLHGIPDVDSRDLSSAEDPVERPPEPRVPEEKRLSPSGSEEDGDSRPSPGRLSEDLHNEYIPRAKHADATVDAISNMLSDIVGADRPHPDMTTHVVSRQ